MAKIFDRLEKIAGKHATASEYIRYAYSKNVDPLLRSIPDYVIQPSTAQEIAEILKVANETNTAVFPRGGGCCEFGGSKPIGDTGIVLDLKRMDKVVELDEDGLVVVVEAGMSWAQLDEYLRPYGLYSGCMGPGSGMTASIGGGISHHSVGGGGCAKYGACTKQLVGLEVVLPTGEIIETGSRANRFTKKPYGRFGNGPDLAGFFSGDNGILGIKTKVALQVFPRPEYWEHKTFVFQENSAQKGAAVMTEIRKQGVDVYDAMYLPEICVSSYQLFDVIKPWTDNQDIRGGILFYTAEGQTEAEVKEKARRLDLIINAHENIPLGPEIEDGNIAKWHIKEQGHWQLYHSLWGMMPMNEPCSAECFTSIEMFPGLLTVLEQWEADNSDLLKEVDDIIGFKPLVGSGPVILLGENNVEVTCGFTTFPEPEIKEQNMKLWESIIETVTKYGAQWYMMGEFCSREFVKMGAFTPEYLATLKKLKSAMDPNLILSRGKFGFGLENTEEEEQ